MAAQTFSMQQDFANLSVAQLADIDILVSKRITNQVVHLRVLGQVNAFGQLFTSPSVDLVVADGSSKIDLAVYNVIDASLNAPGFFNELRLFEEGTELLLRNPWKKTRTDGTCGLRVDDPRDLCFISQSPCKTQLGLSFKEAGTCAYKAGDFFSARVAYTEALRVAPKCPVLWLNRAMTNLRLSLLDLAVLDAFRSIQLDPLHCKAYMRLSEICLAAGSTQAAIEVAKKGMRLSSPSTDVHDALHELFARASSHTGRTQASALLRELGAPKGSLSSPQLFQPLGPYAMLEAKRPPTSVSANPSLFRELTVCSPGVEIRDIDPVMGRGVFTLRAVARGSTVFSDVPLASVSHDLQACSYCAAACLPSAFTCKCGERYCSTDCQELAMLCYHKGQCGEIAQAIARFRSTHLRGAPCDASSAHLLLFCKLVGSAQAHSRLSAYIDLLSGVPRDIELAAGKVFTFHPDELHHMQALLKIQGSVDWDYERLNRLAQICSANCIDFDDNANACVLMRVGTFVNHSCRPNVAVEPETSSRGGGKKMVFTALRDLSPGEQLFINYVDRSNCAHASHLEGRYKVQCDCCANLNCPLRTTHVHLQCGPSNLSRCSRCHVTKYCSRACQIEDWKVHKANCKPACPQ